MSTSDLELKAAQLTIAWAREELALNLEEIGRAVGAAGRTVQRWRDHQSVPSSKSRERIEKFRELRYLLETVFRDSTAGREWLYSPVPALRGRTPMSFLRKGDLDDVIGVLSSFAAGSFD